MIRISRVWWINVLLAFFSASAILAAIIILMRNPSDVPETVSKNDKSAVLTMVEPAQRTFNASEYEDVTEKNIFAPDRSYSPNAKEEATPEKEETPVLPDKELVLFGTLIAGDFKYAIISNPGIEDVKTEQVKVKMGETAGRYTIKDIRPRDITVTKDGQDYDIPIYKKEPSGESGNAAVLPSASKTERKSIIRKIGANAPKDKEDSSETDKEQSKTGGSKPGKIFKEQAEKKEEPKKAPVIKSTQPAGTSIGGQSSGKQPASSEEEKYEIMNTPFGQFKRKVK